HPDPGTRHEAISDLTTYCSEAKSVTPALVDALASVDGGIRCEAALFLVKQEPGVAHRALDTLAEQIVDPLDGSYLLWDIIRKLRKASPGSLTRLARSLVDSLARASKPESRLNAILALGELGPEGMPAVPALLDASRSGDREIAVRAVEAL